MRGAYGRLAFAPRPVGNLLDDIASTLPTVFGGKDVGAECSKWTGEVVKWANKKPDIFTSSAKIAASLAEAKAEKARTCAAAAVAADQAQAFADSLNAPPPPAGSWLSTTDPTYLLAGGVAIVAGLAWWASRKRR